MGQTFNIAICDDEKSALDIVESVAKTIFAEKDLTTRIYKYLEPRGLIEALKKERMSLVFLDIELKNEDGVKVAREICDLGIDAKIVFISSHEERVFDSLKAHPYGFVRKGNFVNDFTFVINSFLNGDSLSNEIDYRLILEGKNTQSVRIKNISYIESEGKNQVIHLVNPSCEISTHKSMTEFSDELSEHGFIRIHKSFLVNSDFIKVINSDSVSLNEGTVLYVSKRKIQSIKNAYLQVLKSKNQAIIINKA